MISTDEIKSLPIEEKMQLMQMLYDDMHERYESSKVSPEMAEFLDSRLQRMEKGEVAVHDWDEVKGRIGRKK